MRVECPLICLFDRIAQKTTPGSYYFDRGTSRQTLQSSPDRQGDRPFSSLPCLRRFTTCRKNIACSTCTSTRLARPRPRRSLAWLHLGHKVDRGTWSKSKASWARQPRASGSCLAAHSAITLFNAFRVVVIKPPRRQIDEPCGRLMWDALTHHLIPSSASIPIASAALGAYSGSARDPDPRRRPSRRLQLTFAWRF